MASSSCALRATAQPIVVNATPKAVIEDLWLRVPYSGVAAITCLDSPDVLVRRVRIEHAPDGVGIKFERCHRIRIEDVAISALTVGSRRPSRCGLRHRDCDNIHGIASEAVQIERVRVAGGASGVELQGCAYAHVRSLVALNVLGPYPRGQCVQFSRCARVRVPVRLARLVPSRRRPSCQARVCARTHTPSCALLSPWISWYPFGGPRALSP